MTRFQDGRAPEAAAQGEAEALAKAFLEQGAIRQRMFGDIFRQPAWDTLLWLYVAGQERTVQTLDAVCRRSGEPISQAHNRLCEMEREGLVMLHGGRGSAPNVMVVEITNEAAATVECLLHDLAAGRHMACEGTSPDHSKTECTNPLRR